MGQRIQKQASGQASGSGAHRRPGSEWDRAGKRNKHKLARSRLGTHIRSERAQIPSPGQDNLRGCLLVDTEVTSSDVRSNKSSTIPSSNGAPWIHRNIGQGQEVRFACCGFMLWEVVSFFRPGCCWLREVLPFQLLFFAFQSKSEADCKQMDRQVIKIPNQSARALGYKRDALSKNLPRIQAGFRDFPCSLLPTYQICLPTSTDPSFTWSSRLSTSCRIS